MPSGDNGWNCTCKSVLCLILIGGNDIQEERLALKNGSLMLTAEQKKTISQLKNLIAKALFKNMNNNKNITDAGEGHSFSEATFLTVDSCCSQGALAGISIRQRDAGGAVGAQRRGAVLDITHWHGLGTERSLPSKWALATADGHSQTLC